MMAETTTLLVAALLGAIIGSFLNVVIVRLPKMLERRWRIEATEYLRETAGMAKETAQIDTSTDSAQAENRFNLAFPASHCPHCGAKLAWWENIPIVSWLMLRGRCHHCHASISPRYLIVELLTAMVTAAAVARWGVTVTALLAAAYLWVLIALAFIDWETQLLPDDLTLPLLWLGLLANLDGRFAPLPHAVVGALCGYLLLWSLYWLFKIVTGKEGMGYGDFKLLAALGAWLGVAMLPQVLLVSASLGAVIGITARATGRLAQGQPIPFGPFLAFAGVISLFAPNLLAQLLG
ncbi:A24 family peptidase [Hydrogenophilus islandicus]